MKPINEYTLQECLDKLRNVNVVLTRSEERELADRIHELTRWIPVSERMPDENEDSWNGMVFTYTSDGCVGSCHIKMFPFVLQYGITHWRRIDTP